MTQTKNPPSAQFHEPKLQEKGPVGDRWRRIFKHASRVAASRNNGQATPDLVES